MKTTRNKPHKMVRQERKRILTGKQTVIKRIMKIVKRKDNEDK